MRIIYYPGKGANEECSLKKRLETELRKKCFGQWRQWDGFVNEISQPDYSGDALNGNIKKERMKAWDNRHFAFRSDYNIYEYRGTQHREGTIRIYCWFTSDTFYILHAECKTGDKDEARVANGRKSEMGL